MYPGYGHVNVLSRSQAGASLPLS